MIERMDGRLERMERGERERKYLPEPRIPPIKDTYGDVEVRTRSHRSLPGEYPQGERPMSEKMASKLYSNSLSNNRVTKIPDYNFLTARMTWNRLVKECPVPESYKRLYMAQAFGGLPLRRYELLAAKYPMATTDELWDQLEQVICNKSHLISLRSKYVNMRWREKSESIGMYSVRLKNTAENLPEEITDEMMLGQFVQGLPPALKKSAISIVGGYDEVVSRIGMIASMSKMDREGIGRFEERGGQGIGQGSGRPGQSGGTSSGAGGLRTTPPPVQQGEERYKDYTCYHCGVKGHISRWCPAKKSQQAASQGNDMPDPAKK